MFDKTQATIIRSLIGQPGIYTVPATVTSIGNSAFAGCCNLTGATIPDAVTNLGAGAFYFCPSLTNVTLGAGITRLGNDTFSFCSSLTGIAIPDGVSSLGADAFSLDSSLTGITMGSGIASIGDYAFQSCSNLVNVTLGLSVTNLGNFVFYKCSGLTGIYFRSNAPAMGASVFSGNTNALVYYLPGTAGWSSTLGGLTTTLWLPQAQNSGVGNGGPANQFGFHINWAGGQSVVVDACTNLANPVWSPIQTNTLTSDSLYFSDAQWADYPGRFYRAPRTVSGPFSQPQSHHASPERVLERRTETTTSRWP